MELSLVHSRAEGFLKSYRNLFSGSSFCPGGILGLFFRDGFVVGLSGLLLSPRIPFRISVETSVLEIACLDLGLGLIMGISRQIWSLSHLMHFLSFSFAEPRNGESGSQP